MTDPLIAAARFLTAQLPWLRHATDQHGAPVAADVFRKIGDCAARMRSLVDGPRNQIFLGICGAEVTWDDDGNEIPRDQPCAGYVFGDLSRGVCRACRARWDNIEQRLARLEAVRREHLYRASEIEDAYPEVKAATVRKWSERGLLAAHGMRGNSPLYLVGEVLDLYAADAARREEIRAERDRRRKARQDGSMTR